MLLVFVHGWSVRNTDTYGGLPQALVANAPNSLCLDVKHLYLGKYVSFADEVTVDDIARGMQNAVATEVLPQLPKGERFACITHSTGGPVVRKWIDLYYRDQLVECPLSHLVMLAPANHGSALAQLGKGRLSRMKSGFQGVEPGVGVLDWLELGSEQSWELNRNWLSYDPAPAGLYPFVLTGQSIDRELYDNLNNYTGEAGSDGVVRVAAANMNYGLIRLVQENTRLTLRRDVRAKRSPLGVLPGLSHSGADMGILRSVTPEDDGSHPTVKWALRCLAVGTVSGFNRMVRELSQVTDETQEAEREVEETSLFVFKRTFKTSRYCMLVIRIVDDRGHSLSDYDVFFTAGIDYDVNKLPPGFFIDRQRNQRNPGKLTYLIDCDVMQDWFTRDELDDRFGFKICARPKKGFAYYKVAEHKGRFSDLKSYFSPNKTMMIEIELMRHVDTGVFQLTQNLAPENITDEPSGTDVP